MSQSKKWPPPLRCFLPIILGPIFFNYLRPSTSHLIEETLKDLVKGKVLKYLLPPIIGFATAYYIYDKTSAKKAGAPNQAEVWLKSKGWVSDSFCFSMTYNITLFSRVTINIHLHHWLYCLLSAFGVNILETRTQFGKDITEDIGDFVMGWLYGMAAGGISQGLSYSDWTHCIWLTQPPPRLVRRTSSLESIISITSDPDYGLKSEEARSARTMRGVEKEEKPVVLRRETLKWAVAAISLLNMALGVPLLLGVLSPKMFLPNVIAMCESELVERIFGVGMGIAAIQLGLLRWLFVRNFYGNSRGLRWLAAGSFLLEVLRDVVLLKEGMMENGVTLKITVPAGILAISLFLIQPEANKMKTN